MTTKQQRGIRKAVFRTFLFGRNPQEELVMGKPFFNDSPGIARFRDYQNTLTTSRGTAGFMKNLKETANKAGYKEHSGDILAE